MAQTPINLNKVRKARARDARKREAERNVVVHGMTRAERLLLEKDDARWKARVDGARRERIGRDPARGDAGEPGEDGPA